VIKYALLILLVASRAWAAPAFDAFSQPTAGTGNLSWTHTPVGTPKGVYCLIVKNNAADQVSSVTYGGEAMTETADSPLSGTGGGENGSINSFFLGSSIPTGAQTVAVTVSGAADGQAGCWSITASANTTVDDTATFQSGATTTPLATLATTASTETVVMGILYSGAADVGDHAPDAAYTESGTHDFTNQTLSWVRKTANPSGGNVDVSWTQISEDAAVFAVAIKEVAATRRAVAPVIFQ
jgi:hypothetical protein